MRRDPLKLWDTSWCSEDVNNNRATITQMKSEALNNKNKQTNKQTNKQNKKPGKKIPEKFRRACAACFSKPLPLL